MVSVLLVSHKKLGTPSKKKIADFQTYAQIGVGVWKKPYLKNKFNWDQIFMGGGDTTFFSILN